MKKSLLFIFFCCMSFVAKAQTIEEIEILTAKDIVPTSIVDVPTAYQNGSILTIRLGETATYSTVTITNKETGEQVYSMIYAGTDHIQLDLSIYSIAKYTRSKIYRRTHTVTSV